MPTGTHRCLRAPMRLSCTTTRHTVTRSGTSCATAFSGCTAKTAGTRTSCTTSVYNEPILQPAEPENLDVDGVLRGIYLLSPADGEGPRAQILASGVAVPWALEAQQLLAQDWGVRAAVWSVTSWGELRRDGLAAEEHAFLYPGEEPQVPYLTAKLQGADGPFVATSDYAHPPA